MLITILAAMAEQESRSISTNVKWAYQKKFQNGEVQLNYKRFLGYTRDEDGKLIIVPEEAKIVTRIYREFLSGYSISKIAKQLTEECVPTPSQKSTWYPSVIMSILQNEKYTGNALLGKTYKPDVLSKKRYKNEGQAEQYYVEDSHPAIIPQEMHDMAQAESARRSGMMGSSDTNRGRFSSKYAFSKMIVCGHCGGYYRRHAKITSQGYIATWVCATHKLQGNGDCPHTYLLEGDIKAAYIRVLAKLSGNAANLTETIKQNVMSSLDDSAEKQRGTITELIDKEQQSMLRLNKHKRSGEITEQEYRVQGNQIAQRIETLNAERASLQRQTDSAKLMQNRLEEILSYLNTKNPTEEFDEELFKSLIEQITIRNNRTIEFEFKIGIIESTTI